MWGQPVVGYLQCNTNIQIYALNGVLNPTLIMFGDKLNLRNYSASIKIDSLKDLYFTGDHVSGTFEVVARSSLTVSTIVVTLRCDEDAYVFVDSATYVNAGAEYVEDHLVHVRRDQIVFPEQSVSNESDSEPPNFTLKEGTHKFHFDFEIPMGPQTIANDGDKSSLNWNIAGVVHRGSALSKAIRTTHPITVTPRIKTPLDLSQFLRKSEVCSLNAYLPGYNERVKGASGRLKEMFTSKSDLRKEVEVSCYIQTPKDGLPQAPAPLLAQIGVSSSDMDVLFFKKLELDLKTKLIIDACGYRMTDKKVTNIAQVELNLPMKQALTEIRKRLKHISIDPTVPATYRGSCLILSYKLVATYHLTSKEHQAHTTKVRVSLPVLMRYKGDEGIEVLPPYDSGGIEHAPVEKVTQ